MWRNTCNVGENIEHQRAASYHSVETVRFQKFVVEFADPAPLSCVGDYLRNTVCQFLNVNGFVQIIAGALLIALTADSVE
jgi:hypothetical protein